MAAEEDKSSSLPTSKKRRRLSSSPECPYQFASIFQSSRGIVNYSVVGEEGPLVLTFHGLNGTRLTFQDIAEVLKRYNFRVLTFDLYGHGLSACPPFGVCSQNYDVDFFVQQTDELLHFLGFHNESASLIGFSMGCIIAAGWAQKHPEKTLKLALISPAGMLEKRPFAIKLIKSCQCVVPCVPFCICRCCFCRGRFIDNFSKEEQDSGAAQILWDRLMWQLFIKKGVIPAFLGCVSRVPIWSARDLFGEVGRRGVPTLVLWGAADAVVPHALSESLMSCFSNAHLITFPGSSHLVLADAPEGAVSCILTFLEFPNDANMSEIEWLLPFNPSGTYRKPSRRHPPEIPMEEYFRILNYRPKQWVKLPSQKVTLPSLKRSHHPPLGETILGEQEATVDKSVVKLGYEPSANDARELRTTI